jgi:hypothetical protein
MLGKERLNLSFRKKSPVFRLSICLLFFLLLFVSLPAQIFEHEDGAEWEDSEIVRRDRKSAATAIIMSSIFPGSGHFYSNRRSIGTFIFPVIEIALWAGYIHFNNKGDDIERDYIALANTHYDRNRQDTVQDNLINNSQSSDIYTDDHFRLDSSNTQHFYEDIGKYNKYIFGWEDWYRDYFEYGVEWKFDEGMWIGNYPTHPDIADNDSYHPPRSELRRKYIEMRREAQDNYDRRVLTTFGLALNRIVSALDVVRVTTVYNRELRYSSTIDFGLQPAMVNNQITPTMNMQIKF